MIPERTMVGKRKERADDETFVKIKNLDSNSECYTGASGFLTNGHRELLPY